MPEVSIWVEVGNEFENELGNRGEAMPKGWLVGLKGDDVVGKDYKCHEIVGADIPGLSPKFGGLTRPFTYLC